MSECNCSACKLSRCLDSGYQPCKFGGARLSDDLSNVKVKNRFILSLWHLFMVFWSLLDPSFTRKLLQYYANGVQSDMDKRISEKLDR